MTDGHDHDPSLEGEEPELSERLEAQRPVPAAGFRGTLGRHLEAEDPGYGPRPERLRVTVTALCAGGSLLVALGALTAVGIL